MKTCAAILMALAIAMSASAQNIDRLRYFQEHGVMDPQFSSEAANSLVYDGIASKNPQAVDITIRGLGGLATVLAHDLPHVYASLPTRTFHTVPGLKQFLIEHWRKEHKQVGFSTFDAIRDSVGFHTSDDLILSTPSPAEWGLEVTDTGEPVDLEAFVREMSRRIPAWLKIPQILSVYWPGDTEVEEFFYEMRDIDSAPNVSLTTLGLLNIGQFTSETANALRLSQLENPGTEVIASTAVILAAEGLALSRPPDALPALLRAGERTPAAQKAVVVAVAGYDESQLDLYADQIRRLVQGGIGPMPTTAEKEAYEKLVRVPVVQ